MAPASQLSLGAGALLALGASALQIPLNAPQIPVSLSFPKHDTPAEETSGKLPLVDSWALQRMIEKNALKLRAQELYDVAKLSEDEYNHPTRVIGSKGHEGTLDYITSALAQLGDYYSVSNQPFPAVSGNVFESKLSIGSKVPSSASPMGLTPPTKNNEPVYGELVVVANDGCEASDYPSEVAGNVAYIRRGTCPFGTKSELTGKAGGLAAVVYDSNPDEDDSLHGTLGSPTPNHVATFGLSGKEGAEFLKQLNDGKTLASIAYIDAIVSEVIVNNVIAQTTAGDPENCVMAGAHSDSVAEGPGINDDGSGTISLIEVATHLSKFSVNNCVRFAWWAGEEEGLLGSDFYVASLSEEENQKIRLFMDYDMMASPNYAYQIYNATNEANPNGSGELKELYIDWYEEQGLNYTFIPFDGRSDYDGFIRNGIPGGGIATGAEGIKTEEEAEMFGGKAGEWYDHNYHQIGDDTTNVDLEAWEVNTKLIAHSVATYAKSFEGFPERTTESQVKASAYEAKYHGPKLIM